MNVVFISPHFPPQYHHFCRGLKQAGAIVLGIGDAPNDQLHPELRDALTKYYHVTDMDDYGALLRACGWFTHQYGKIDRIDSLNEYWLATEARLRDDFNIFGIRGKDIDGIRRKSKMKEIFRAAGVPVAKGQVVHTIDAARTLITETGYPVVAKPDAGVGALATWRLDNEADLKSFFKNKPQVDYILEAFVSGAIHSFDGLTDHGGNIVFCTGHIFSQGIMETVNEGRHIHYYSLRELPEPLEAMGRRCVREFGLRERFFHIEFFKTGPEDYVALEVNMRPPGGFTTDMLNYAADVDIYRAWAEMIVNGKTDLDYQRRYHCCYASRKTALHYTHPHEQILDRYGAAIVQVASVPGVFASALGEIGYIFRSKNLETIFEITDFIHETRKD
jgi:hypothetical protein